MRGAPAYLAAREALLRDLRAAFEPAAFGRAHRGVRAPDLVSVGGDSQDPPFEVVVWPLPQSVRTSRRVSGDCAQIESSFELVVGLVATGTTEADATAVLLWYVDTVYQVCMADPRLGGTVDSARPVLSDGGVGPDGTWGNVAAARVGVSCSAQVEFRSDVARAVREAT